jgi:hypothetical protein
MADKDVSFRQHAVIEFLVKEAFPLLIFTADFSVCMEMCAWVLTVLDDGQSILKMGARASKISLN